MSLLRELLVRATELDASDIHLKVNEQAIFRIHANLVESESIILTSDLMASLLNEMVPPHARQRYEQKHEVDFSMALEDVGRYRVNIFFSQGQPAVALRHVKTNIPSFDDLRLPPILKEIANSPRGIVLTSGTTGSGKSTSLAAMIQHINVTERRRIITIEDPIEYVFKDNLSIISQREVGLDTVSFHDALKYVLRQDPDVIMVGEMRDAESFGSALAASETGHLVFSTVHTDTASQTIPRILNFFPATERDQIRMSLATNVRAVMCQRLIPCIQGGVAPAIEIMINTSTVRKLIEKNQLERLSAAIETGNEDGMQTFNQAIYQMIKNGVITEEEGMPRSTNPETLKMNLKGIFLDEARRILSS